MDAAWAENSLHSSPGLLLLAPQPCQRSPVRPNITTKHTAAISLSAREEIITSARIALIRDDGEKRKRWGSPAGVELTEPSL